MKQPSLKYDFSNLIGIASTILYDEASFSILKDLKDELNKFFVDSECIEVIFTNNTDKLFFGMYVIPEMPDRDAYLVINTDEPVRINKYSIEIDSKLTNPVLDINPKEFVAFLLHEVGHVVNDNKPTEDIRHIIDAYMAKNHDNIKIKSSIHYKSILYFGIINAIQKITSIFYKRNNELIADEFVYKYGFGEELQSGFGKIIKSGYNINSDVDDKLSTLMWSLRLYKDVKYKRISALKTLNKAKSLSGSKLEKRSIDNVTRALNSITDEAMNESVIDDIRLAYKNKIKGMKYNSLRSLEDDFYEYNMRMRNIEDEEDALYLMRQINTRIAIIDDYISTSETNELSEEDFTRWGKTLDNFKQLRDKLSKMAVYKVKSYGVYVNYPDIKEDRY